MNPVPGGANGTNVVCIQAGDLNSGAYVSTFALRDGGAWEQKENAKAGSFKFDEKKRADVAVDLFDPARGVSVQLDFERKKIRFTRANPPTSWTDLYHMLNATDKDSSQECMSLANRNFDPAANAKAAAARVGGGGASPAVVVNIKVGTPISVPPGTKLDATGTSKVPCPGQPGFFLCPNKFSCAPNGGVCCPGGVACPAGQFCDRFVPNSCIGPGNPAFCANSGNPVTGVLLHCQPGSVCLPGNVCNP